MTSRFTDKASFTPERSVAAPAQPSSARVSCLAAWIVSASPLATMVYVAGGSVLATFAVIVCAVGGVVLRRSF